MLTRSPVPPSASPSSFRDFHYAPAAKSLHPFPSLSPAAVSRRQSTSSLSDITMTSPSHPQARQQSVSCLAGTSHYSPTVDSQRSGGGSRTQTQTQTQSRIQQIPPPPSPRVARSMQQGEEQVHAAEKKQTQPVPPVPAPTQPPPQIESSSHPLSPSKRRNSQDQGDSSGQAVVEGSPKVTKRVKSNESPPKVLPLRYELCAVEDVVVLISNMLSELIETNDALALKSGHLTRFHSRTAPGISVVDYLHRLAKHATLTPPLLLSMVYYIDRLCALYPDFTINTLTVHRFLITAATVAAKGLSDSFWNNSTYARVGGVRLAELKLLELEFLYRVDWKIVPNPEVLVAYYRGLVERSPGYVLEGEQASTTADDADVEVENEGDDDDEVDEDDSDDIDEESSAERSDHAPLGPLRQPEGGRAGKG